QPVQRRAGVHHPDVGVGREAAVRLRPGLAAVRGDELRRPAGGAGRAPSLRGSPRSSLTDMRIRLDRSRKGSLVEQARDQIVSGLHAGLLRNGDRLPSLRQVASLSALNVKTILRVYAALQREGLLSLRKGSGAFVTVRGQEELEPAQAVSLARLLRRHLDEASG